MPKIKTHGLLPISASSGQRRSVSRDADFVGHGDVCLFTSSRMSFRRHPELALPSRRHPHTLASTSALRAIWSAESRSGCWNRRPAGFLHLGRPDAGIQGCFGDGDIRWWAASLCGTVFNFKKWPSCFWQRELHSSSHEWVGCMVLKQRTSKKEKNAKTNEWEMPDTIYGSLIILHLHIDKEAVAEAPQLQPLESHIYRLFITAVYQTQAFSHREYLPRPLFQQAPSKIKAWWRTMQNSLYAIPCFE